MTLPRLDHLIIAAHTLDAGNDWFEVLSGVRLGPGGHHPRMGTHNRLARFSDNDYLEIVAIDPEAQTPAKPRWFGLDQTVMQQRLPHQPELVGWMISVADVDAAAATAREHGFDVGEPIEQVRADLHWRVTVRTDGKRCDNGTFPLLIQWPDGMHPAPRLADVGVRLEGLNIQHPDTERFEQALAALGATGIAKVNAGGIPHLSADMSCHGTAFEVSGASDAD